MNCFHIYASIWNQTPSGGISILCQEKWWRDWIWFCLSFLTQNRLQFHWLLPIIITSNKCLRWELKPWLNLTKCPTSYRYAMCTNCNLTISSDSRPRSQEDQWNVPHFFVFHVYFCVFDRFNSIGENIVKRGIRILIFIHWPNLIKL